MTRKHHIRRRAVNDAVTLHALWQVVKSGDSVAVVAKRFGMSESTLRRRQNEYVEWASANTEEPLSPFHQLADWLRSERDNLHELAHPRYAIPKTRLLQCSRKILDDGRRRLEGLLGAEVGPIADAKTPAHVDAEFRRLLIGTRDRSVHHTEDFGAVWWFGDSYVFSRMQADFVRSLWRSWKNGIKQIRDDHICKSASWQWATNRADNVFKAKGSKYHDAWKRMVRRGDAPDTVMLYPPRIEI